MNAAVRVLAGTRKFDRGLTQLMHDNLHWLDVPERVKYSHHLEVDSSLPHRYRASVLAADCVPVSEVAQRRHLRSAAGHQLVASSELMLPSGVFYTRSESVELLRYNTTTMTVETLRLLSLLVIDSAFHPSWVGGPKTSTSLIGWG